MQMATAAGRMAGGLATVGMVLFMSVGSGAQETGSKEQQVKTPEETVEKEGPLQGREEYMAKRRRNPDDPNFNAAEARYQAVLQMKARSRPEDPAVRMGTPPVSNPNVWQNIGPGPINNGQTPTFSSIPSDVSGRVTAIAIDPVDSSVYVGGAQGGVWKSLDNGATWTVLTDGLASLAVGSIAIDPAAHTAGNATIYIGTGEANGSCDSYGGVGVYKSINSGTTWTGPFGAAQFSNRGINSLVVDRTNSNRLVATSSSGFYALSCTLPAVLPSRGVFLSTNGGSTWTKQSEAQNNRASKVVQDPRVASTWWAAMWFTGAGGTHDGGLLKSIDSGVSWVQVAGTGTLPAAGATWGRAYVTATVDNPTTPTQTVLYLSNEIFFDGATGNGGSLFKSVDSGANWTSVPAANGFCGGQCFYDQPIYADPANPLIVYLGSAGGDDPGILPSVFMRSDNGGTSFADKARSPSTNTAMHADMHFITSWPSQPNRIWVGNDGGVWRSDDRGDTWVNVNNGLSITQFQGCDFHPSDPGIVYAGSQDNGTEGWQGSVNWKHLDFGDGGFALIDKNNSNNLVHTYFNAPSFLTGVGFTTSGFATTMGFYGGSFAPANGISFADNVLFYAPIHLDRGASPATLYFGTNHLWRANNFFATAGTGGEFVGVNSAVNLAPAGGELSAIETFANGTANANIIYTGADSGELFRTTNANVATPTWTQVDVGGSALYVSDIRIDPSNSNVVYVSRADYAASAGLNVRKSTNGGANWAPAANGIPNVPVNAIELDPITANKVWAGTDIGVYSSLDGGANWAPDNAGMPAVAVFDMKANAVTKQIMACTHGRSAYIRSLDDDLIFRDGVESRDFSRWSTLVNNGGLSITAGSAMAATTRGIRTVVAGTNPQYVQDNSPNSEPRYRARFYFNPNSFDTGESANQHRTRIFIAFNGAAQRVIALVLRRQAGVYAIEARLRQNDGSRIDTGFVSLTNAAHFIEFDWVKATTGLTNGTFTLYIDGVPQGAPTTGVANNAQTIDAGRMGALSTKSAAAGTMFFDQFESRRVNYCGPAI
jgi:hypothetical protein